MRGFQHPRARRQNTVPAMRLLAFKASVFEGGGPCTGAKIHINPDDISGSGNALENAVLTKLLRKCVTPDFVRGTAWGLLTHALLRRCGDQYGSRGFQ